MSYSDKPWLKSYFLGPFKLKPTMEPYPKMNVYQFLEDSTAKYGDNIACIYAGEETTYTELKLKVDKLASALIDFGMKKGDSIASVLPTCPEFVIVDYAAMKLGIVHVPLSILHKAEDLLHELKESNVETVLCSYRRVERVNEVKDKTSVKTIIYTPTKLFPGYKAPEMETISGEGYHLFDDILEKYEPHTGTVEIDPMEDLALLPFTGGTTGLPKGVMLTHFNITTNIIQSLHWMMDPIKAGAIGKAAVVVCVPVFHQYGHWCVHAAISWGLKMYLMDPRDIRKIAEIIKSERPFLVAAVPTHYIYLKDLDIPKAQIFYYSAATALPKEVAEEFEKKAGVPMGEGYGATETTGGVTLNLSAFSKVTGFMKVLKRGVGIPVPDTDVKVVGPDGQELPFGEAGELWIRGPQVMKGYWPEKGKGLEEGGWLPMGDVGVMDEDGYFQIVDRIKDMISVSGYKVYSRVIDDLLTEHPAVDVAGVIGLPDPDRPGSERVKAFVALKKGYEGKVTEQDIILYLKDKVKPYAVPKEVEFRPRLPLTMVMKINKKKLREEEREK